MPTGMITSLMELYFDGLTFLIIISLLSNTDKILKFITISCGFFKGVIGFVSKIHIHRRKLEALARALKRNQIHRRFDLRTPNRGQRMNNRVNTPNVRFNENGTPPNRLGQFFAHRLRNIHRMCISHQLFGRNAKFCSNTCQWRHAVLCTSHSKWGVRAHSCLRPIYCQWNQLATPQNIWLNIHTNGNRGQRASRTIRDLDRF